MTWYNPNTWFNRTQPVNNEPIQIDKKKHVVTPGRSSRPTFTGDSYVDLKGKTTFINPGFIADYIPVIRKLSWINPDLGVAVHDMVQLTNTGHRIKFDPEESPDQQKKMRMHLKTKRREWGDGVAHMTGLINKMITQIWISGALSVEWVVENDLSGIKHVALVNPETIRFRWDKSKLRFFPYQKQDQNTGSRLGEKYVKLNTNTYKYFGLNGDTDIPYGIPPYLTALNAIATQGEMDKNIRFIMRQIGLLGFAQLLMEKPGQNNGETDDQYKARLEQLLSQSKDNILDGIKEGVVVGYNEDHEFDFKSTTKNLSGVSDIYNMNEVQVANGLKMASEFIGTGGSGSETGINIIFTKMLSQLQNVQKIVAANLKHGYLLELRLAGFNVKNIEVEFETSTITDDLKFQQAQEYKIRNIYNKYKAGVIGMQQMADELGYDKPDAKEPRAELDSSGAQKEKRQDQNDKSDKKTRDKAKPQPKKGEQKSNIDLLADYPENLINEFLDWYNK